MVRKKVDSMLMKYHLVAGRYSKSAWLVEAQVRDLVKEHPDFQMFTEVSKPVRAHAIEVDGYTIIHSIENKGAAECAISVKESSWEVLWWATEVLSKHQFFTSKGAPRALVSGLTVVIQDKAKEYKPIVLSIAHMPPNVETARGFSNTVNRVIAWNQSSAYWRRYLRKVRRQFKTRNVIVAADWNLDIKKKWVRRTLKAVWRTYRFTFRKPYPVIGDLGHRLITFAMFKGLRYVGNPDILPLNEASDHRTIEGSLKLIK